MVIGISVKSSNSSRDVVIKPYFYGMRKSQNNSFEDGKRGEKDEKVELKKFYLYLILLFVLIGIPLILYVLR